jgi:hypothetical protein
VPQASQAGRNSQPCCVIHSCAQVVQLQGCQGCEGCGPLCISTNRTGQDTQVAPSLAYVRPTQFLGASLGDDGVAGMHDRPSAALLQTAAHFQCRVDNFTMLSSTPKFSHAQSCTVMPHILARLHVVSTATVGMPAHGMPHSRSPVSCWAEPSNSVVSCSTVSPESSPVLYGFRVARDTCGTMASPAAKKKLFYSTSVWLGLAVPL